MMTLREVNPPRIRQLTSNTTRPTIYVDEPPEAAQTEQLANSLGWFSIALGLTQLLFPALLARLIGVKDKSATRVVMRMLGLRELASGVGILNQPRPKEWLWARAVGDAMDLALLGAALRSEKNRRDRTMAAFGAVVGVTILDVLCAQRLNEITPNASEGYSMYVKKSITVNRPLDEVYGFWRHFQNLPRFMSHLESVEVTGERQSHWRAKAPAGMTVEWDAVIVQDEPNTLIAWQSIEGAEVDNRGAVRFKPAPLGKGTEVHVEMAYEMPGGKIGEIVAKLFGEEPQIQIADDLRAFKQMMETGEILLADGAVLGERLTHKPARPDNGQE